MKAWVRGIMLVIGGKVSLFLFYLFGIIITLSAVAQIMGGGAEIAKESWDSFVTSIRGSVRGAPEMEQHAAKWQDEVEWVNPETGQKVQGLTDDLKEQVDKLHLGLSPGVLWALTQMKRSCDEECIVQSAAELAPKDLIIIQVPVIDESGQQVNRLLISSLRTYREVIAVQYTDDGSVHYVKRSEEYGPLYTVMEEVGLDRDKKSLRMLLTMAQMYDPGFSDVNIYDQSNGSGSRDVVVNPNAEFSWPIPGVFTISSTFGPRRNPIDGTDGEFHKGLDIRASIGTEIEAVADGEVDFAGWAGTAGNMIRIIHDSGYTTRYLHLSEISVKRNQKVVKGEVIGKVGSTGSSTGAHLHLEIIPNDTGAAEDPLPYFSYQINPES